MQCHRWRLKRDVDRFVVERGEGSTVDSEGAMLERWLSPGMGARRVLGVNLLSELQHKVMSWVGDDHGRYEVMFFIQRVPLFIRYSLQLPFFCDCELTLDYSHRDCRNDIFM